MKKIIILSLILLSVNVLAKDYVYHGVKNIEATVGLNSESESAGETISENCYTAEVGKRGSWQGCDGLLIVDNNSLREMVLNDENYSDTNIFTGQVTNLDDLFSRKDVLFPISNWNTINVTSMQRVFYHSKNLIKI